LITLQFWERRGKEAEGRRKREDLIISVRENRAALRVQNWGNLGSIEGLWS
jgi:hypothetical protein